MEAPPLYDCVIQRFHRYAAARDGPSISLIEQYYPRHVIPPKTQFLLEELLGSG